MSLVRPLPRGPWWGFALGLILFLGGCVVSRLLSSPWPIVAVVAGILLFGTSLALRKFYPMMRIDYIRIPGVEWVKDPDRRFDTVEIDDQDPLHTE